MGEEKKVRQRHQPRKICRDRTAAVQQAWAHQADDSGPVRGVLRGVVFAAHGRCKPALKRVQSLLADAGYVGEPFANAVQNILGAHVTVQITKRSERLWNNYADFAQHLIGLARPPDVAYRLDCNSTRRLMHSTPAPSNSVGLFLPGCSGQPGSHRRGFAGLPLVC